MAEANITVEVVVRDGEVVIMDCWPKLSAPAMVAGCTFEAGVSARMVVEAAQRQYARANTQAAPLAAPMEE